MKLLKNKEISRDKWLELINNSIFSSPFQHPSFYESINSIDDYSADVFAVEVSGSLKVLVVVVHYKEQGIKAFFSRRGIIYGGPLCLDSNKQPLHFLLERVIKTYKGKTIYLETRNFFDYSPFKESFVNTGWSYKPYLNFHLSLKNRSKDNVLSLFNYNRRREIKQSLSEETTYGLCEDEKEIEGIYDILKDLYSKKVKLPLPALSYFLDLNRNQIVKVFVVKHNGKIIGGSICPFLENRAIYTYYYCGLRNYHKRIFPTHLAVLAAIEYAIDNNIPLFDFMGAGKPNDKYGVRDYKSQFGGELVEHGRFIKILNPFLYQIGKLGIKVLSKIK